MHFKRVPRLQEEFKKTIEVREGVGGVGGGWWLDDQSGLMLRGRHGLLARNEIRLQFQKRMGANPPTGPAFRAL